MLTRFRKERVALVADIEGMYYQIKVHPNDRNTLSFLWWKSGCFSDAPSTYRITSHLFGAKSSPSVALFCLKETEQRFGKAYSSDVCEAVRRNFYVDDCLVSVATVEQAQTFAKDLKNLLLQEGFSLKKWSPKIPLTDEMLRTFLVEVESIINSRPLVPLSIDARNNEPLTPNHLLLLRSSPNQCPGVFEENSSYARKKWIYVQHLANVFWKRWIDEFLPMLNKRQKWLTKEENLKRDSIVLLVDERVPQAKWLLGRVVDVLK